MGTMRTILFLAWTGCSGSPTTHTTDGTEPLTPMQLMEDPDAALSLHTQVRTVVWAQWTQEFDTESTWVSWQVDGETLTTPATPREAGDGNAPLLGTPADTTISAVLHHVRNGIEETQPLGEITTGNLPRALQRNALTHHDPSAMRPEPYLLTNFDPGPRGFFGPWYTLLLDTRGRIVWYFETPGSRMSWQASPSAGHLVIDITDTYTHNSGDELLRTTLDFVHQRTLEVDRLSTAFDEMPDGGFVYGFGNSITDYGIARIWPDGSEEIVWTCDPWMEQWTTRHWKCNANTVTYDASRNSVLYSMFETDTVVEIGLDSGEMLRELGQFPGGLVVDPPTAELDHQHLPTWTPQGTFLTQTDSPLEPGQWVREYAIDDDAGTMEMIYSLPSNHFAEYGGHAQRLPSGNILWAHGTGAAVEELTATGEIVWAVDYEEGVMGNATPIADLYALNRGL